MRKPTDEEIAFVTKTIDDVLRTNCFGEWTRWEEEPYLFAVEVPIWRDRAKVERAFNELFHVLGLLPEGASLGIGGRSDYCSIGVNYDGDEETYRALFNVPSAKRLWCGDEEYQYTLKEIRMAETADRIAKFMIARRGKEAGREFLDSWR